MARHWWLAVVLAALPFAGAPMASASDNQRVIGHMTPLRDELLPRPYHLTGNCAGVVIKEWDVSIAGTERTRRAFRALDALCHRAVALFPTYAKRRGLKPRLHGRFVWSVALIPDGYCYRCMNDTQHRFVDRFSFGDLWAYTSEPDRYIYLTNQVFDGDKLRPIWVKSWIHELWHAQSMASGIFDSEGPDNWDRVERDEECAEAFTTWVLGR